MAELDAIIKGLTLAVSWDLKELVLITDSQTVFGWLIALLNYTQRVKVSGLHEVVVKRRLQIISYTIQERLILTGQTHQLNHSSTPVKERKH